jgi:lysozyme
LNKAISSLALLAGLCAASGCSGRESDAETPAATTPGATTPASTTHAPTPAEIPDAEAASIPTANGIPLVPVTAPVPDLVAAAEIVRKMPMEFNVSHTAVELTMHEETLQLKAYELGGLWLIGYGHLMLEGESDVITAEQAEAFLKEDLTWCEGAIERYVAVPVTLNEFSAMVAFCYNIGSAKTRGSSVVKKINIEDRPAAANGFLLWNRMNGVVKQALANRRAKERTLFLTP